MDSTSRNSSIVQIVGFYFCCVVINAFETNKKVFYSVTSTLKNIGLMLSDWSPF